MKKILFYDSKIKMLSILEFRIAIMMICILSLLAITAIPVQASPVCECTDGNMYRIVYQPDIWKLTDRTRKCLHGLDGYDVIQSRRIESIYQCDHCCNRMSLILQTNEESWSCRGYAD